MDGNIIVRREVSPGTLKIYRMHFARFARWCGENEETPLPASPLVVFQYLSHCTAAREWSSSTINVVLSAIEFEHEEGGYDTAEFRADHNIRTFLRNTRRRVRLGQTGARPMLFEELMALVNHADKDAKCTIPVMRAAGVRDAALFPLMWAGAFRRSEVTRIRNGADFYDYNPEIKVMSFKVFGTKGAQGEAVEIHAAAEFRGLNVRERLEAWLAVRDKDAILAQRAEKRDGVIFPWAPPRINEFLKHRAELAGVTGVSSHSFRVGSMTDAANRGASVADLQTQLRHASPATALRYVKGRDSKRVAAALVA